MEREEQARAWRAFADHEAGDRLGALMELGDGLREAGDHSEAVQAAVAALDLAREAGDTKTIAAALTQAGRAYAGMGNAQAAREMFQEAAPLWGEALHLWEQGNCFLGAFEAARDMGEALHFEYELRQAHGIMRDISYDDATAFASVRLAQIEFDRDEMDTAFGLLEEARLLADGNVERSAMVSETTATFYLRLEEPHAAMPHLWQALDLTESVNGGELPLYEAWRVVVGLRLTGDIEQARDVAHRVLGHALSRKPLDPDAIGSLHLELARCAALAGSDRAARPHYRKARSHLAIASNATLLAECDAEIAARS